MKRTCKQCGKEFELTEGEISFFKSKNLELPKRCKDCRKGNQTAEQREVEKKNVDKQKENSSNMVQHTTDTREAEVPKKSKKGLTIGGALLCVVALILATINPSSRDVIQSIFQQTEESQSQDQGADSGQKNTDETKQNEAQETNAVTYHFRTEEYLTEHFKKHGSEFDYKTSQEYEEGANRVINTDGVLHKKEQEDNDDVYYLEETNEFVIVSTDGYLRTYFKPQGGLDYYNRQ